MAFRLNKAKIRQGVYILCCSEAEAKNLLSELEKIGYSWNGNDGTPMSETFWSEVRYGKIAYYIRDDQRKKLQYRVYDFDDVENRMVSYADVMLEEQFVLKLSPKEEESIYELLDRAENSTIYLVCHDAALMRAIVEKALEYGPGNIDEWKKATDFSSFDTVYFDWDGYLVQTSSEKILKGEESVVISREFLQSYGEHQDKEDEEESCPLPEPQSPSKEPESKSPSPEASVSQPKSKNKKEKTHMNIFGINMEFGMNTDDNITSTFIGVAVKNGKSWRVYDKKKKALTDIGDMSIGSLPLFVMPSTKLEEGDLIKSDGGYYYVIQVNDGNVKTLSAATGKMEEVVPVDNILGIRFYSKVVTLAEDLLSDGEGDSGTDRLMMAMAMSSMTGDGRGQDGQMLLPLLLLKDKGDGDEKKTDRLTKLMLISSMCGNGGDQNAMLPLLLLKGDLF